MKILLMLIAAIGFVTGIGLGSVAARQIAARAIAQQSVLPVTIPVREPLKRMPVPTQPSQRDSLYAGLEKAFAVRAAEDDPSDLDEDLDDIADDIDPAPPT